MAPTSALLGSTDDSTKQILNGIESQFQLSNDGLIEIVTIFTGVRIAARYKDSRAYVGTIYFIPNILGTILINVLPLGL